MNAGAWMHDNLATQGYLWNQAVRRLVDAPELPRNRVRRRHAFKLATVWLAAIAVLLAAGASTAGLALGGVLVGVCGLVTATNFCIPSTLMAGLVSRRRPKEVHA